MKLRRAERENDSHDRANQQTTRLVKISIPTSNAQLGFVAQLYSEITMSKFISALMNLHLCLSKKTRL